MKNWVNKLFRRNKPQAEAPSGAASPREAAPIAASPPKIPADLLREVAEFGFDDFRTCEQQNHPHLLQSVTMTQDNYLHRCFSHVDDILRKAYQEADDYPRTEEHTWSRLRPEVAAFIDAQDAATAAAFKTFLRLCTKYSKSVFDTEPNGNQGRTITVAQHAFSNAEAAELKDALEKIWKVMPDSDPRMIEGMDYAMASQPAITEAFSGYTWMKNDSRSDFEIAGKVKSHWTIASQPTSEQAAAIARQSAENIALLKPQAPEIAEMVLSWCLARALDLDANWRVLDGSRETARKVFSKLDAGETPAALAQAIQAGDYGPVKDKTEDTRKRTAKLLPALPDALALALDIRSGAWFDSEEARLRDMAKELGMTPGEKAERERERHDRAVEEIVSEATVLQSAVQVKKSLRLKHGG